MSAALTAPLTASPASGIGEGKQPTPSKGRKPIKFTNMQTNDRTGKRGYQEVLRAKLADILIKHHIDVSEDDFGELLDLVKAECLQSFKNGLAAGRKGPAGNRASRPAA